MATIFSPSAIFTKPSPPPPNKPQLTTQSPPLKPTPKPSQTNLTVALTAAAASIFLSTAPPSLADAPAAFTTYYGTAAGAASYGGYGGNASKRDSAEYVYDVPQGWKERLVSKVEKGTNGTDSEFYNPKKRTEKEYLTFLYGFRQLAPKDLVLNNLALSDVNLQDLISTADAVTSVERKDENGQLYYEYEIDGVGAHSLISVTFSFVHRCVVWRPLCIQSCNKNVPALCSILIRNEHIVPNELKSGQESLHRPFLIQTQVITQGQA